MKSFDLSDLNQTTKVYWSGLITLGLAACVWAVFNLSVLTTGQTAWLIGLFGLTFLAGLFPIKVPDAGINLTASDAFVFLCVIYIGVPAAILLAAFDALVSCSHTMQNRRAWGSAPFAAAVGVSVAGGAYRLVITYYAGIVDYPLGVQPIRFSELLFALIALSSTYYAVNNLLLAGLVALKTRQSLWKVWANGFLWKSWSCAAAAIAAGVIRIAISQYGFAAGLIGFPLILAPYAVYRQLFRRIEKEAREVEEAGRIHLAAVEALVNAVDAREQVATGHIRRVQTYAVGLGRLLGLPAIEIRALESAALLHDIGKLAVPDYILNKPGKLTLPEMERVKIHASVGAEILETVNFTYPVVPAVLYHHERWDGIGYPDGLRSEEIPITARILAIADAYDVMRSSRPYRAARSREEARKGLLAGAGTQFDPKLVDIFLRNSKQLEDAVEQLGFAQPDADQQHVSQAVEDNGAWARPKYEHLEQIRRANLEVFALYELAKLSSSSLNVREMINVLAEKVQELVPCDTCVVYLYHEPSETATAAHVRGKNAAFLQNRRIKIGEGVTGFALKNNKQIASVSPAHDFTNDFSIIAGEYMTMAALPLMANDRLVGGLTVYSEKIVAYEEDHMRLLETVSHIAASALFRAIKHHETESRALTDPMTGLPNARCLQLQFEKESARAKRTQRPFQVIMLDLDEFKKVNDTFGHKAGDLLLKEVSRVMQLQLRDYDFLARYAGDEFVAIIPEVTETRVQELCERMERAVLDFRLPVENGQFARVGISIGSAAYPTDGETLDQVLIAADRAMYATKAAHKRHRQSGQLPPLNGDNLISVSVGSELQDLSRTVN